MREKENIAGDEINELRKVETEAAEETASLDSK